MRKACLHLTQLYRHKTAIVNKPLKRPFFSVTRVKKVQPFVSCCRIYKCMAQRTKPTPKEMFFTRCETEIKKGPEGP
ncbi:MAG: hypothetical protein RLZZ367_2482 [Bacteroidota bacterium]|jgi:hypothetical protein